MAKMINVILSLKDRFSGPVERAANTTQKLRDKFGKADEDVTRFEKVINNTARNIGKKIPQITAAAAATAVGSAAALLENTKELRNDLARLEANAKTAGIGLNTTSRAMQELSKFSDETDSNVEALSNLMASGLNETQMMRALESLSGAAIKFSDTLKIEGLADGFEETIATGMGVGPFSELIERLGYNLDDFNAGLQAAKQNGSELEYTLEFLDKTGLSKVKQTYEATNADLIAANQQTYLFQQRMAKLGGALQPVANRLLGINKAGTIRKNSLLDLTGRGIDKLTAKLGQWEQNGTLERVGQRVDKVFSTGAKAAAFFADNIGLIGPVVTGLAVGFTSLNAISKVTALLKIANPQFLAIALAIAAVSTVVLLLVENWDKIKTAVGNGVTFMQDKLNGFANLLESIKVPSWLTDLSKKVSDIGSEFGRALNKANDFIFGANKAKDAANNIGTASRGSGTGRASAHATGTSYFAGGLTKVHEGGRGEIINLPSGTQIIPHDISKRIGSGISRNTKKTQSQKIEHEQVKSKSRTVDQSVTNILFDSGIMKLLKNMQGQKNEIKTVERKPQPITSAVTNILFGKKEEPMPTHATGTPYFAGGDTIINEGNRGEVVNLPSGSQIIPNDISKKQSGMVQNLTVHLHIAGNVIGNQQYADYIGQIIAKRIKLAMANM